MYSLMISGFFASILSCPSIMKFKEGNFYYGFNFFQSLRDKTHLPFRETELFQIRVSNICSNMSNEASSSIFNPSNPSKTLNFPFFPAHSHFRCALPSLSTSKNFGFVSISDVFFFTNSSSIFDIFKQHFTKIISQNEIIFCLIIFSIFIFFNKNEPTHNKSNFHQIHIIKHHKSNFCLFSFVLFFSHCFQIFDSETFTLTLNSTEYSENYS